MDNKKPQRVIITGGSEGIGKGVGFDLRERKIWNTLKNLGSGANQKIDLRVSTISPNETNLGQF